MLSLDFFLSPAFSTKKYTNSVSTSSYKESLLQNLSYKDMTCSAAMQGGRQ